jgi:glycosyltransferase involved in cell wall biosynthesis
MQVAGAEVLVSEIIHRLGSGIRPTIFCLDSIGALGERLQAEGVDVVALNRRPGLDFGVARALARGIRERDIEVVHAHQYTPFFYPALGRLVGLHDARIILTEHGRHYPDIVSSKRRLFNHLVLDQMADAVNAVCGFSADALGKKDGFARARIEVIENGIDLSRYTTPTSRADARAQLGLDAQRQYVACVARFHPVKDHATLIKAFAKAAAARPQAHLLLVGDGPLRGDLTALVSSLGLTDRVTFMGVRRDVPLILCAADVFALTSVSEGASITLLEAQASALPIVVTAVGGNPELVRDGLDGLLAPRADVDGLGAALLRILEDEALAAKMGQSGQQHVREQYRLEDTVQRYDRLYRTLARPGFRTHAAH